MSHSELCFMTATELVRRIRTRELSCKEVMEAHLIQIERINPIVNAIVTHVPREQIMSNVQAADEAIVKGQEDCPSVCRLWDGTMPTSVCYSWPTRFRKRPKYENKDRL